MNELDDQAYAAHWWRLAIGDLAGAIAIAVDPRLPPRLAASHAQQAAEKALKAAIALTGAEPPLTHDLVALNETLVGPARISIADSLLDRLSDSQATMRYPEPSDLPTDAVEVDALVEIARVVVEAVRVSLRRRGLDVDGLEPD